MTTPKTPYTYETNGANIYRESFATIRAETDLTHLTPEEERVAVRMIHSCGSTDLINDIIFSPNAAHEGITALNNGAPILTDTHMVASGITRRRLPANNDIICTLHDERVPELAATLETTRTAAGIHLWGERIDGAIIAIGNAPTALFHLLNLLHTNSWRPALILGIPVGFVGAIESKEALHNDPLNLPHIIVRGRRGGSAITCGALNALASSAE
ncbi:precorrin-8X methylmutase [Dermatophilus congolensis]|uniref:precorrin-8X methylmutase n=1 Tax=Dermatophilus congolensis TaxID=1863 RepID=UPI001AAF0B3E|nr:precorrin-8X methylmutase [Dermatophilus congolensis]MBO3143052.1 precorrin-8X methylmutase [Dermatophilus congolensis]MBO3152040.1 precorrin-8X methylmutase [Dermatophilus congolensis]MBO3160948.1 precorrin-8X methylmutase [Dermatophilus congolensis]MBO3163327.1 precorrin-8X methylmutase [Dermatophilus congolensis]MBO3176882.1 precorrin-8X methylmutase [Dermatophilus congolensis]